MNLHDKKFVTIGNHSGLSSDETIFHYFQAGEVITGKYSGGVIKEGFIVGKQTGDNTIELLYQCITIEGELKAGDSRGFVSGMPDGRMRIEFDWSWLNGDLSGGKSEYIELL
ncbi:MAG: hypothetical protein HWD92_09225 [Flavobacteriia bacterium]|nr:hypothetical protein [Flavobacteriia bacterium]